MSILNFDDGSIPVGYDSLPRDSETTTTSLTGAFNANITLTFAKIGNMATITIPPVNALETGVGGNATGAIQYPPGFTPANTPQTSLNPYLGIYNLSLNNDLTNRNGNIRILNGTLYIGTFAASGTTTNTIGIYQSTTIPYICS